MHKGNNGNGKKFKKGNEVAKPYLFQKGQSGNPGGLPKSYREVRALAQSYGPDAIQTLANGLKSEDERIQMYAAVALLERGFGKPKETVEVHSFNHATEISDADLERIAFGGDDEHIEASGGAGATKPPPSTH